MAKGEQSVEGGSNIELKSKDNLYYHIKNMN